MIMQLELIPFTIDHFPLLEREITDAQFLMQWAGPKYGFPLSWQQMEARILEEDESGRKNYLFSARLKGSGEITGHIQLSIIDRNSGTGNIGSVLVFSAFRKRGLGKELMDQIMEYGFCHLGLNELRLGVFDFNSAAISCYLKSGFTTYDFEGKAREVEHEKWNLVRMKISREDYGKENR